MIKADIVKHVAKSCGLEPDIASLAVESTLGAIKRGLLSGQNVYIRGFGTFELRATKEKVARNISQNTFLTIPAHTVVKFKPSPRLADSIYYATPPTKGAKTEANPAEGACAKALPAEDDPAFHCAKALPAQ